MFIMFPRIIIQNYDSNLFSVLLENLALSRNISNPAYLTIYEQY